MNANLKMSVADAAELAYHRGLELSGENRWSEAARAFEIACEIKPDDAVFWVNLANAKAKLNLDEAIVASRRALELQPDSEPVQAIAAQTFVLAHRYVDVARTLEGRDFSRDKTAYLQYLLGHALFETHRPQQAIPHLLGAISKDYRFYLAHYYLGHCLDRMNLHLEARIAFDTAIQLGAPKTDTYCCKAYQSLLACRWDLFDEDFARLKEEIAKQGASATVSPFYAAGMPFDRRELCDLATANWRRFWEKAELLPARGKPDPSRRPRIGFLSNDFVIHATAYLIVELFERIDRSKIDVHLYSYGPDDQSAIRKRIIDSCHGNFTDIDYMTDHQAARRIREDGIDILIDLKLFTKGARLGIPAYRPAPVQVNFLGYPGSSGAPCYDYVIGDPVVTPIEHADTYTEKIAQRPDSYQPNDTNREVSVRPSRADCGLPEGAFVFCCFNNTYKISRPSFDRWCRILAEVPNSVLWLYEANAQARASLTREAGIRGIEPGRLVWAAYISQSAHIARLANADLVLDALPYNAHTTASDALWAGVPVLTLMGNTFAGRVAAGLLRAAGLDELVTHTDEDFVKLGISLGNDARAFSVIRSRVEQARHHSRLFDSERYARGFESLMLTMFNRLVDGSEPAEIVAPTL